MVSVLDVAKVAGDQRQQHEGHTDMAVIFVALEVSHVEICPYLASVTVASSSHSSAAPESVESSNDDVVGFGVGDGVGGHATEPLLPANMLVVVTDETSQHRS